MFVPWLAVSRVSGFLTGYPYKAVADIALPEHCSKSAQPLFPCRSNCLVVNTVTLTQLAVIKTAPRGEQKK